MNPYKRTRWHVDLSEGRREGAYARNEKSTIKKYHPIRDWMIWIHELLFFTACDDVVD